MQHLVCLITRTRLVKQIIFAGKPVLKILLCGDGGGEGGVQGLTPLYRPIRGCTAGQGMVFVLSVLNRVYDFVRVCPKQVYNFLCVYNQVYNFVGVRLNCKQGIVCCRIELICLMKFVCTPVYKSIDYYVYLLYCNFQ